MELDRESDDQSTGSVVRVKCSGASLGLGVILNKAWPQDVFNNLMIQIRPYRTQNLECSNF